MEFSKEELEEFKNEAVELLDEAEKHLLSLEKGADFGKSYDAVFRVFHSLKGGAGMLGMQDLQSHMHQLESHYQKCKHLSELSKETITYFLKGVDGSRRLLDGDEISFVYQLPEPSAAPTTNEAHTSSALRPASEPTLAATQVSSSSASQKVPELPDGLGPIKVMIIDDEIALVSVLRDLLQKEGFDSIGFTSPKEALQNISLEKPDVLITDIQMDSLTGFDVLKHVAEKDPDLPVVFVSGYITKELIIEALSYGVFAAIEKPFSPARVIEVCANAGQRYRLLRLLNSLISFVYYQYSDLESHWQGKGGDPLRATMRSEFKSLIEAKRKLKSLKKSSLSTRG